MRHSGKPGTLVTIEHGEILNDHLGEKSRGNDGPGGSIYNLNYRSAKAQTLYTLSGIRIPVCLPSSHTAHPAGGSLWGR